MEEKDLIRLYKIYGNKFIEFLAIEIKRANKVADGKLLRSLSFDLKEIAGDIILQFSSEKYLKYVDEGRKPGKYAPIKAIESWCNIKGIPKSASWAINKNIYKFGIKPTNVIQKAQKSFDGYINKRLEEDLANLIEGDIINIIKNFKQ